MHELPTDLTNSLRSFRGSMYGSRSRRGDQDVDLERGAEYNGVRSDNRRFDFDGALNTTNSSLVLHPTKSAQGMRQHYDQQAGQNHDRQRQRETSQHDDRQSRRTPPQHDDRRRQRPRSHYQDPEKEQSVQHDEHGSKKAPGKKGPSSYKETYGKAKPPAISPVQIFGAPPVEDIDPAASRLADDFTPLTDAAFYDLMGINPPSSTIYGHHGMKKLARPSGLFETIYKDYRWVNQKYHAFDMAAYTLLTLQLIISAVFIILGSLHSVDTHVAIAALGAVATVIAGVLALMQGQGLPSRLRRTRDSYENVLFEFEELYFDKIAGNPILFKDIKKLREDYLRVLQSEKLNHPDTWTESANNISQGPKQMGTSKGVGGDVMV